MAESEWRQLGVLALAWLAYCAVHSALASLRVKRWVASNFAGSLRGYRIVFNSLAILSLLPILWLGADYRGPLCWAWRGPLGWLSTVLALAALCALAVSLKYYDGQEFLGLRQWRSPRRVGEGVDQGGEQRVEQRIEDREDFQLSPLHRYVRHPWYCCALVLIWTRDMNAATLVSSTMISAYFVVGSRLEEAKLLVYHGAVYRRYMQRVAGLLPLPWKTLSAEDAAELVRAARRPPG